MHQKLLKCFYKYQTIKNRLIVFNFFNSVYLINIDLKKYNHKFERNIISKYLYTLQHAISSRYFFSLQGKLKNQKFF